MKKLDEKKLRAFELRKGGLSYNKIAAILNIQKSTLAYWFKDIDWSRDIKKQLIEKAAKISVKNLQRLNQLKKHKFEKLYEAARQEADAEFLQLKNNPLFIAGVMIYWGEGDKTFKNRQVRMSNVDSAMLNIFNIFLKEICNIDSEKIKAYILLYPDLDPEDCLKFWSENVNISKNKFYKPIFIKGRHKTKRLGHGVCSIHLSSKYLKAKILQWIELFREEYKFAGLV